MPELVDLEVHEVSLVDRPAHHRPFRIFKREGGETGVKKQWFCLFKKASPPEKEEAFSKEEGRVDLVPPPLAGQKALPSTGKEASVRKEGGEGVAQDSLPEEIEAVIQKWAEAVQHLQEGQERIRKRMEKLEKQMAQKQSQEEPEEPPSLWTGILG